jgi:uncharacterized membrane protein YfcA
MLSMTFDWWEISLVAAVFVIAGIVKGVIGLGLPTIAMGLLGALMTPGQAAAILIVPALLTNVWQMFDGPALKSLIFRLWPMLICALLGTLPTAGILTKDNVRLSTALLGAVLMVYALVSLVGVQLNVSRRAEPLLGPLVGLTTGLISGATGIFVMPNVPYLQAQNFARDELVQAVAISAFVSSMALALGLGLNDGLDGAAAAPVIVALAGAFAGMWVGKSLRSRLSGDTFRRAVLTGLLLLGASMIFRWVL